MIIVIIIESTLKVVGLSPLEVINNKVWLLLIISRFLRKTCVSAFFPKIHNYHLRLNFGFFFSFNSSSSIGSVCAPKGTK